MKAAVLDIGGSFIKYGQLDEGLEILNRGKVRTPLDKIEHFYDALDEVWGKIGKDMSGLAVSMPGVIDSARGYLYSGGSLTYLSNQPFARELQERYHVPVWIGNDAKCAGVAEAGYGALQGVDTAVVLILGTGIGGCLIRNGKVYTGKHFSAGEFSFLHIHCHQPYNRKEWWACQNGAEGLLSLVQKETGITEKLSGEEIFAMALDGNAAVIAALDKFTEMLAVQLFNLQCIYDPEVIAIGGGISAQPLLIKKINEQLTKVFSDFAYPVCQTEVVPCRFRNDANLIGAYYQFSQMG